MFMWCFSLFKDWLKYFETLETPIGTFQHLFAKSCGITAAALPVLMPALVKRKAKSWLTCWKNFSVSQGSFIYFCSYSIVAPLQKNHKLINICDVCFDSVKKRIQFGSKVGVGAKFSFCPKSFSERQSWKKVYFN